MENLPKKSTLHLTIFQGNSSIIFHEILHLTYFILTIKLAIETRVSYV